MEKQYEDAVNAIIKRQDELTAKFLRMQKDRWRERMLMPIVLGMSIGHSLSEITRALS